MSIVICMPGCFGSTAVVSPDREISCPSTDMVISTCAVFDFSAPRLRAATKEALSV